MKKEYISGYDPASEMYVVGVETERGTIKEIGWTFTTALEADQFAEYKNNESNKWIEQRKEGK